MTLIEFQEKNSKMISRFNKYLKIIQSNKFSDDDRGGLYNSAIIYNNKISELIRLFDNHKLVFFDNVLWPIVEAYLQKDLLFCLERLKSIYYDKKYFSFLTFGIPFADYRIDISAYKYFTLKIDMFNLEDKVPYAVLYYYDKLCLRDPQKIVNDIEVIKSEMIQTLTALNMQSLIEDCIKIIDICYDCATNNLNNKIFEPVIYNPKYKNKKVVQTYMSEKLSEDNRHKEEMMSRIDNIKTR